MDWLIALFSTPNSIAHILLAYSIVIALGMALGKIKIFGVSLGVTFVLFTGLLLNYLGMKVDPTVLGFIRDFGLILFVFFIGLQVGPSFFSSFKSGGIVLNGLMVLAVVLSVIVTIVLYFCFSDTLSLAQMLGVHYGAVTNRALEGRSIGDIRAFIARPFICSRILHDGVISSPSSESLVHVGDVVRIVSGEENKDAIVAFFGEEDKKADLATEHSPITSKRLSVTRTEINGLTVADLHLSHSDGVNITRVYRAGMQLFPYQNLHIQMGDELYCVGPANSIKRLEDRLGNKIKRLEHPNLIAIFIGIAVGILFGSLPIVIPGMPVPLKLGLAGGPLIIAILLGRFGSLFRLVTYTTSSANLMLRELGISLFLASVGLAAGENFVDALLVGNGPLYVVLGLLVTIIPLLTVGCIARHFFHINYHSIVGLMAGATTDPPTLAYAATLSEKNSSAVAYSTVYPLAMFLRILTGQLVLLIMWSFVSVA